MEAVNLDKWKLLFADCVLAEPRQPSSRNILIWIPVLGKQFSISYFGINENKIEYDEHL